MKKIVLLVILIVMLSGCEILTKWRDAIRRQIFDTSSSVSQKVDEFGNQITETTGAVKQKVQDVKDAAKEVKEAADQVSQAVDAVKKIGGAQSPEKAADPNAKSAPEAPNLKDSTPK